MSRIARAGLDRIPTYAPQPLDGVDLDLRDNVNLWGAPPHAMAALRAADPALLTQYPSVGATRLVDTLARSIGVRASEIVAGCGSDDLIDACFRAVASPGDRVAHADPSFSMVPVFARLNHLEPVGVPLLANGAADIDGMLATGARIMYLCSPNNPTGTVTPAGEVRRLIHQAPGIVVIDEAYAEFASETDWRVEAPAMERVFVLRTFSKAWGLAGLRVGYGVGASALVESVIRSRGPYKVNAMADRVASVAVEQDSAWMQLVARETRENRDRLNTLVRGRVGIRPWDSRGNFVFWEVADDATQFAARFQARGIGVRAFRGLRGIGDALRIGMAPWDHLTRVASMIEELWP
jgi:histidinol-phosphate aminotransferase